MRLRIAQKLDRLLPPPVATRLTSHLARIDAILSGADDSAVSQRTALFAFAIRVFSAAIAYLSQVLMARWMGDFEYGIYVAVWVAAVILGGIACLGFQTGVIRFISEYRTANDLDHLRGVIRGALSWSLAAATVLALIGCGVLYMFSEHVTSYYVVPIYLAAVCLPMMALQETQDGVARAFNWPGTALGPTFIARPLLILAAMALFVAAGMPADANTAMLAAVIATYGASVAQFVSLRAKLGTTVPKGPSVYRPREWLLIAMPIFLVEGFYNLLTNTDILFVSYYLSPDQVAVYFAAVKTLALVHFVYFAVKAGAAHRFAAYRKAGDTTRYEAFIQETVAWTFWPSLALAIVMVLFGRYFLMLFGPSFLAGESLLWILAFGVVVRSTVGAAESVLTMSGEQATCAAVYAASLMVNLTLNFSLIPVYGLQGAAWATTFALFFEAIALYAAARRRLGLHIFIIPVETARNGHKGAA
ncbi:MAG: polysaccharide biosynthesis C-terminal domain-containing protein [Pseudomonadota bacterium]|nr:polysaccharide biosynthesis C-terminal domain-containing protein [Pseudomonadota bacterium]